MSPLINLFRKFKKARPMSSQSSLPSNEVNAKGVNISEIADEKPLADPVSPHGNELPLPHIKNYKVYQVGDLIAGQFEVKERLEGCMAYVYLSYDRIQNISFAIKQPKPAILAEPVSRASILQAAKAWTELGMHPHIANCYFVRDIEDVPHLFVEHVVGNNLRDWIRENKCGDLRLTLNWAIQVCHGIQCIERIPEQHISRAFSDKCTRIHDRTAHA